VKHAIRPRVARQAPQAAGAVRGCPGDLPGVAARAPPVVAAAGGDRGGRRPRPTRVSGWTPQVRATVPRAG